MSSNISPRVSRPQQWNKPKQPLPGAAWIGTSVLRSECILNAGHWTLRINTNWSRWETAQAAGWFIPRKGRLIPPSQSDRFLLGRMKVRSQWNLMLFDLLSHSSYLQTQQKTVAAFFRGNKSFQNSEYDCSRSKSGIQHAISAWEDYTALYRSSEIALHAA